MSVPYTFATASGNIPLSQLDVNFSNVKNASYTAGTVTTAAQPNITSVGTLTSLSVSGNVTATNFIGTISGNIANAAYADAAGSAGIVTTAAQPNITSVGTLTSLTVNGNINGTNVIGTHYGPGTGLTSVPGANVTGTVANATYATSAGTSSLATIADLANSVAGANVTGTVALANSATYAGTVTTNAQPNITSVGTLTSLSVSGNVTGGNLIVNNKTTTTVLETGSTSLGSVSGSVTIDVSAGDVQSFTTAGNVTLSFTNWGTSGLNSKVTLLMTVANAEHNITAPLGIKNSFGVVGLDYANGIMYFPVNDVYSFTFSSTDHGSTIFLDENNVILRPYNSTSETITNTSNALISLGTTYSTYYPSPVSTSGTAYLKNGVPGQTKVVGSLGLGNWVVTVPSASWGSTITFSGAGQNATLIWSQGLSAWLVLNTRGSVVLS